MQQRIWRVVKNALKKFHNSSSEVYAAFAQPPGDDHFISIFPTKMCFVVFKIGLKTGGSSPTASKTTAGVWQISRTEEPKSYQNTAANAAAPVPLSGKNTTHLKNVITCWLFFQLKWQISVSNQ